MDISWRLRTGPVWTMMYWPLNTEFRWGVITWKILPEGGNLDHTVKFSPITNLWNLMGQGVTYMGQGHKFINRYQGQGRVKVSNIEFSSTVNNYRCNIRLVPCLVIWWNTRMLTLCRKKGRMNMQMIVLSVIKTVQGESCPTFKKKIRLILLHLGNMQTMSIKQYNTVKLAHVATSIKQSHLLKCHLNKAVTSIKPSPVLKCQPFSCPVIENFLWI